MPRPEVTTVVRNLEDVLEDVRSGRIRVPKFLRPFVWNRQQMVRLLESIELGYPIGSLIFWETTDAFRFSDRVGPKSIRPAPDAPTLGYLLDGQQRLTTLLGVLLATEQELDAADAEGDTRWRMYLDLDAESSADRFVHHRYPGPQHLPMCGLLDTEAFLDATGRLPDDGRRTERVRTARRVVAAFQRYRVAVISISRADLQMATQVFARLNTGGRGVSPDQVFSALTYQEGVDSFDYATAVDELLEGHLQPLGFGGLSRSTVRRVVLAALGRDVHSSSEVWGDIAAEAGERLPDVFTSVRQSIVASVTFLRVHFGIRSHRVLPYGLQLVMLSEFFRLCEHPSVAQRQTLAQWMWATSYTGAFMLGSSKRFNDAVTAARDLARGEAAVSDALQLDAPARPLPRRFHPRAARVRAFALFLRSRGDAVPAPLVQEPLFSGESRRTPAPLEHGLADLVAVFPGADRELRSDLAQRVLLGRDHAGDARERLLELRSCDASARRAALEAHLIDEPAWQAILDGDARAFCVARRRHLEQEEARFMERWGITRPPVPTAEFDEEDADV